MGFARIHVAHPKRKAVNIDCGTFDSHVFTWCIVRARVIGKVLDVIMIRTYSRGASRKGAPLVIQNEVIGFARTYVVHQIVLFSNKSGPNYWIRTYLRGASARTR